MLAANRSEGLRRGLRILGLFTSAQPEWGIRGIARRLELSPNQAYRAVKTLAEGGYLQKNRATEKYTLGLRAYELGMEAALRFGFPEARPHMQRLAAEILATITIRIEDGDDMVVIERVESPGRLRVHSIHGNRRPWSFNGAGAKLLASFRPDAELRLFIRKYGLTPFTDASITDEREVLEEAARIRRAGYAVNHGEDAPEIFGVAAPILRREGGSALVLVAAMPFGGLSPSRREEIVPMVVRTAQEIASLLGNGFQPAHGPA